VQDACAFPPSCGGQPARKRGRLADPVQLAHQLQPDALANILSSAGHQVSHHRSRRLRLASSLRLGLVAMA
jgi:hypothetical protein